MEVLGMLKDNSKAVKTNNLETHMLVIVIADELKRNGDGMGWANLGRPLPLGRSLSMRAVKKD